MKDVNATHLGTKNSLQQPIPDELAYMPLQCISTTGEGSISPVSPVPNAEYAPLDERTRSWCGVCKSKTMSVTNLELFVFLYCCRSAHSALHKRNTQPILMQFKITVLPQQSNSKILQTQLHKRTRKASDTKKRKDLKFRDRTAKPKDHVTQETMKYIKIISIWRERHDIAAPQTG